MTIGVQEGMSLRACATEYRSKVWSLAKVDPFNEEEEFLISPKLQLDLMVWPPTQLINFYFVPPVYRVLYVFTIQLMYNACLSYIKHDQDDSSGMQILEH
jgi:protein Mpv17